MTQSRPILKPSINKPLTRKQHTILTHIFTYRFLTINHLKIFLNYKDKRYIQTLLNDLLKKDYLHQIYNHTSFKATGTPAIYYLATAGVRHLRHLANYPDVELRNRYKESIRTQDFINHCLLIADCTVSLQRSDSDTTTYQWLTPSHYSSLDEELPEAQYLQELRPHLYVTSQSKSKSKDKTKTTRYILEHAQARLPHAVLRSRLKKLLEYAAYEWGGEKPAPTILITCDTLADLIYVKRRMRYLIDLDYYDEGLNVRVATTDKVKREGVMGEIWEEVSSSTGED